MKHLILCPILLLLFISTLAENQKQNQPQTRAEPSTTTTKTTTKTTTTTTNHQQKQNQPPQVLMNRSGIQCLYASSCQDCFYTCLGYPHRYLCESCIGQNCPKCLIPFGYAKLLDAASFEADTHYEVCYTTCPHQSLSYGKRIILQEPADIINSSSLEKCKNHLDTSTNTDHKAWSYDLQSETCYIYHAHDNCHTNVWTADAPSWITGRQYCTPGCQSLSFGKRIIFPEPAEIITLPSFKECQDHLDSSVNIAHSAWSYDQVFQNCYIYDGHDHCYAYDGSAKANGWITGGRCSCVV